MRVPTDLAQRRHRGPKGRAVLVLVAAGLMAVIISLRGIAGFYTDFLWFNELHLTSVWKGVLVTKAVLGIVFTALFFVLLWSNLKVAERIAPAFRPTGPEEDFVERYHQVVGGRGGMVRIILAGLFAVIAGPGASSRWQDWLLFRNHVSFGTTDPLFHRDVGFFVFQLPFMKYVIDWLFAAVIIVLIVTAVAHYLNGGIRVQGSLQRVTPQVKAHLSVLLATLALLKAVGYVLQRFELVYSSRGVVRGASYTDVHAQLPALQLLVYISLFATILFIVNIMRRGWVLPVIAVGLWVLVSVVVGAAIPTAIQRFQVQPAESVKESPYIARNITATRTAFNLGNTLVRDFPYNQKLDAAGLADNAETIRNVRLWDPSVLLKTYKRLQEIRTFYQFNDVDVDRYDIGGRNTQTLLSARELNIDGIPSPSWVNRHLVYTHGYAAVSSPGNAVAADGNPQLLLKDLPPQGQPELKNPAIYFGQNLPGYAVVKTAQQEIDFTEASGVNHTSTYAGTGGVAMGSMLRRMALSLRFGDLNPLISKFVTSKSRAMYVRDIDDRVRKAAPFLQYDSDPYPVLVKGRMVWIYDAYTTTDRYPYAQEADTDRVSARSGLTGSFNYVRNSVKVVIDAYNGDMKFYVVDPKDKLVKAYQKAFPKLFTDGSKVDPELREHFRYPEDLFRVQTNMFGLYHMTRAGDFYNKTDAWNIAQDPGTIGSATSANQLALSGVPGAPVAREARLDPYYLLMRLPGESKEDFLILQPFVPFSKDDTRKDLTAFMIAKSDPQDYGKLEAFVMPREQQINGPALVNAQMNQQPEISKEISLLGSPGLGSKVTLGNMLLIPVNQSILYIRPLYVEAESTPVPQFKKALVVFGDKVVMRDSLKEALTAIFGDTPPTLEQQAPGQNPAPSTGPGAVVTPPPAASAGSVQELLDQATNHFNTAQAALQKGDLAGYQKEIDAARDLVTQAANFAKAPPVTAAAKPPAVSPPTTTASA